MPAVRLHIIIDGNADNESLLRDRCQLMRWLWSTAQYLDMCLLLPPSVIQSLPPNGLAGMVLANAGHICVHTWPEDKVVKVDIYKQGHADVDAQQCIERVRESFGISRLRACTVIAE